MDATPATIGLPPATGHTPPPAQAGRLRASGHRPLRRPTLPAVTSAGHELRSRVIPSSAARMPKPGRNLRGTNLQPGARSKQVSCCSMPASDENPADRRAGSWNTPAVPCLCSMTLRTPLLVDWQSAAKVPPGTALPFRIPRSRAIEHHPRAHVPDTGAPR
jgi:hypothetical protein